MVSALWERAAAPGTGGARASAHLCPGHSPRNQFPESETGEGLATRLTEDPREKRWLGLQTKEPQSKGHISQAIEGSPGTGNKVRHEAGSGGGPKAGRVRELPSGILWNGQPPPPSVPSPSWLRIASPKSLAWTVAPPREGLPLNSVGAGEGAHLVSVAQGARAGLPTDPAGPCRLQAALSRGRGPARQPRALRPMALGPSAPALSAPGTFSPRRSRWRRQAGGCALADTRNANTHVEGGPGGAQGSTRAPALLRRSRGHAATAAPTGGAQSRPRPGQALHASPRRCRSALTLARVRAPSATLAPKHPATA